MTRQRDQTGTSAPGRWAGKVPRGAVPWIVTAHLCVVLRLQAVLFQATGDPAYNTAPPGGSLTNSGWQLQGLWGSFLGTPVAPRYFLTAQHVGGSVGDLFWLNGSAYQTTARFPAPDCDLTLWRVCGSFPAFAPLYTNVQEVGRSLVTFGRGTQRGAPVVLDGPAGPTVRGWRWGAYDGAIRWGSNTVSQVVHGGDAGPLLGAEFDADAGPDECHLSWGDSGGAVFLLEESAWRLAGINYSVDGPYNHTPSDQQKFDAALFDQSGLYHHDGTNWVWSPDLPGNQPGAFYATRVSSHVGWINAVLSSPLPDEERLVLQAADAVRGPYRDDPSAVVDEAARTITLPQPDRPRFYRLRACRALTIESLRAVGPALVLTYL